MSSPVSSPTKSKNKRRAKVKSKQAVLAAETAKTTGALHPPPTSTSSAVQTHEQKAQARKAAKIELRLGQVAAAKNDMEAAVMYWTRAQAGGEIAGARNLTDLEKPMDRRNAPHSVWQPYTWAR